ncbi:hypothetical protein QBC41DRAFT_324794 [Cercophora samala]|uniref:Fungal N-terminal domain-containing protein n=1 Tax=Cercophora samala TaxID=330535 RepID=A0AA40DB09_9PEZI|nr:hypothetical protein QBC41DRAFT_324794 [Cercophora samala]
MEAVGALASVVQLLDATLKSSSVIVGFLSDFKHASDDVADLRKSLDAVRELLMQLRTYAVEVQQSSLATSTQHDLARHIGTLSQHFSEDMHVLYDLIPADLSRWKRAKFVFHSAERAALLRRLGGRKAEVTLAISIITGHTTTATHRDIHDMATEHKASSTRQETSLKQLQEQHTRLGESLANLRNMLGVFQQEAADTRAMVQTALNQSHTLLSSTQMTMESNMGTLQSRLDKLTMSQQTHFQSLSTSVSTAGFSKDNQDLLARIIRVETQRTLEPLIGRFEGVQGTIDQIALSVSGLSSNQPSSNSNSVMLYADRTPTEFEDPRNTQTDCSSTNSPYTSTSAGFKEIQLSSSTNRLNTRWGTMTISVKTYRVRGAVSRNNSVHFQLQIDFTPSPWLLSRGISIVHSSGPDRQGFYSICPRIMTYPVYDFVRWGIIDLFLTDDVNRFREMIQTGELSVRARNEYGRGLLQCALLRKAFNVSLYLLKESGYGELLVNRDNWSFYKLAGFIMRNLRSTPPHQIVESLSLIRPYFSEEDILTKHDGNLFYHGEVWHSIYWRESDPRNDHDVNHDFETASIVRQLHHWGDSWQPFSWYGALAWKYYSYSHIDLPVRLIGFDLFMLRHCLDNGEDPNQLLCQGYHKLEGTHPLTALTIATSDLLENMEDLPHDEHAQYDRYLIPLVIYMFECIISHGGDIYHIWDEDDLETAETVTHLAERLDVMNIWSAALLKCGYDIETVVAESERRLGEYKRLHGSGRTGVDVSAFSFDEEAGMGMRRRRVKGKEVEGGAE